MGKPKVMVAIASADSAESLTTLACHLADGMNAEVSALHVVEVPLLTPLEAEEEALDHPGKEILAQAKGVAEKLSHHLSTELLRAREVGEAIVGEAKEQGVKLLVIGHHQPHPHHLSETIMGGTVRYVAHHAPCRVIVQIPARRTAKLAERCPESSLRRLQRRGVPCGSRVQVRLPAHE